MQPKLFEKPAFTVVGMEMQATPMTPEIPKLWDRFGPRMDEVPDQAEPHVSYGLMDHFDPALGTFTYMAGVSVTQAQDLPGGMTQMEVPANTYAVFEATLSTLGDVFGQIYNSWLPTSGYTQAAAPYFERYSETFNPQDPASIVSIYIPVQK
ncbi:MAG: AraC family transcriptional regulator [Caldilineaceae bacterium]|nr:AraC family transcriptional regulator [Caldilineaceae bacterium]MBP8109430.1 AraC family transcriptional regulator [Caldilineaceae bacterium]MBP8121882.1 AraC family transcriptional regulator [Caldilineaceae bacterium]MBP9073153.1 AraC family transcriptional regulator [Caldilineaceae bacterium]